MIEMSVCVSLDLFIILKTQSWPKLSENRVGRDSLPRENVVKFGKITFDPTRDENMWRIGSIRKNKTWEWAFCENSPPQGSENYTKENSHLTRNAQCFYIWPMPLYIYEYYIEKKRFNTG